MTTSDHQTPESGTYNLITDGIPDLFFHIRKPIGYGLIVLATATGGYMGITSMNKLEAKTDSTGAQKVEKVLHVGEVNGAKEGEVIRYLSLSQNGSFSHIRADKRNNLSVRKVEEIMLYDQKESYNDDKSTIDRTYNTTVSNLDEEWKNKNEILTEAKKQFKYETPKPIKKPTKPKVKKKSSYHQTLDKQQELFTKTYNKAKQDRLNKNKK